MTSMTTEYTLRMLGDNVTLTRSAWLELLDELRTDSTLAARIRTMLGLPVGKLARHRGHEFPNRRGRNHRRRAARRDAGRRHGRGLRVRRPHPAHPRPDLARTRIPNRLNLRRDRTVVKSSD